MTLRDQIEEDNCGIFFDFDELAKRSILMAVRCLW